MERRFYKELWQIRFQKMLKLEEDSVKAYEKLSKEAQKITGSEAVRPHLERLIADEKRHSLLVNELLKILNKQPA